jgi:SAM-dependent methyltransferase
MNPRVRRAGRVLRHWWLRSLEAYRHIAGRRTASTHAGLDALAPGVRVYRDGPIFADADWSPAGVTLQFTSDAKTYRERYFERLDFDHLLDRCLRVADVDRDRAMRVLDIGSGGGSSVFAACRLMPHAEIFASDISPQLLRLLAEFAESHSEWRDRIKTFRFDLHRRLFAPEVFDLVIGAAILHHLIDPWAALVNVAHSLKRGGRIILVEPLEAGSLVLSAIYGQVLGVLDGLGQVDGELARVMRTLRLDIQSRLGVPVEKPWTARLDDKWVFDEAYLIGLARDLGLARVEVHPAQLQLDNMFEGAFMSVLADIGSREVAIPREVIECVREFDRGIAAELKARLCPTGIIVFTK